MLWIKNIHIFSLLVVWLLFCRPLTAETPQTGPLVAPSKPPAIEKIGDHLFRVGTLRVDTAKRQITIPGRTLNAVVLEFVATVPRGVKAYESALELDTDALTFNAACILIGLDPSRSKRPQRHFDPTPPEGDPLEILVSWEALGETRQIPAEELLFDKKNNRPFSNSRWVYTGSMLLPNGRFLAELEGVLIGFVHTPAPLIENVAVDAVGRYGAVIFNPNLGLQPGTPVTMTLRALPLAGR